MKKTVRDLISALALDSREHLALVGGGGKTSLMFALAEELLQNRRQVVTSATTKIWHREALSSPSVILIQSDSKWRDKLRDGLRLHGHVFLAQSLLDSGKVQGISPLLADKLYRDLDIDYLLVEADGAAGHPVKAPAQHEPVIPSSVTSVVAMMGLEAMGQQMESEIVFRVSLFKKITGLNLGKKITPPALSRLFLDPEGLFKGTPLSAKRVVFLNKLDLLQEEQEAKDLAYIVLGDASKQIDQVVIGSIMKDFYLITRRNNERYLR